MKFYIISYTDVHLDSYKDGELVDSDNVELSPREVALWKEGKLTEGNL